MICIGIDPGKGGGIASVDENSNVLRVDPMPLTLADTYMALIAHKSRQRDHAGPVKCVMEWVSASPQMGVVSAFTFGRGFGNLEAFLLAAEIPTDLTTPAKWQRDLQCQTGGNKNISKARAQQVFPSLAKITHAIADALLIAEWCRRKECGLLRTP